MIYPLSSFVNASSLKPFASSANAPKLELEFVSEKSAPDSVTKCFAYPIAKTDTSCKPALLDPFIWKFS